MATEQVVSFYNDGGTPTTGLTPAILWLWMDWATLFSGVMDEVGMWWYKYTIQNYNKWATYLISVDGWGSLPAGSRYQNTINYLDSYPNKLDWRGTFTFIMDEKKIAEAVWSFQIGDAVSGSYGSLFVWGFNYEQILSSFEVVNQRIAEIKMPSFSFPEIPKGISPEEIEALIIKHKPVKDQAMSEAIEGAINLINNANDNILNVYESIKEIGNEDVLEKLEWLNTQEVIEGIAEMKEFLSKYDDFMEDAELMPKILEQYTDIVKSLGSTKNLDEKVSYMTLVMKDILAKMKK